MLQYSVQNGDLVFRVQVAPRASRSEVVGEHNGSLRVRLVAPPVDGAANEELRGLLARTFNVSRSSVQLVLGRTSRTKQIRIVGVNEEVLKIFQTFLATASSLNDSRVKAQS